MGGSSVANPVKLCELNSSDHYISQIILLQSKKKGKIQFLASSIPNLPPPLRERGLVPLLAKNILVVIGPYQRTLFERKTNKKKLFIAIYL